jgi:hypothetical protein
VLESDMQDHYSPISVGTRGTVNYVDDCGHIGMKWDNNSGLNLIIGEDNFRKLTRSELIIEDVNKVRHLGNCPNMFDYNGVLKLASKCGYENLCEFMVAQKSAWGEFILTGKLPTEIDKT